MIPLSLYIHIPWCEKKCPYCDFNSHMAQRTVNEDAYIRALLYDLSQDLSAHTSALQGRPVNTIFIGGGTPSLFSAASIAQLLQGISQRIEVAPHAEITLEANPGSSELAKFSGFREAGINRLSIGVQSFNNSHLKALGRVHSQADAITAASSAKQAGFDNFNLDLMFGLPEQSKQQALDDLQQAIKLKPSHLSCYQLTIEPNTLFYHQPPARPDDDALWEIQTTLQAELKQAGHTQYEVSAYARNNHECQHNLNYWQFGDYLGIGAGAHSKISNAQHTITRSWKVKHPNSYLQCSEHKRDFTGGSQIVANKQKPFEFMMNALRLTNGFALSLFEQRTGCPPDVIQGILDQHQNQQLLSIDDGFLRLTARGAQMIDSMLQDYLPN